MVLKRVSIPARRRAWSPADVNFLKQSARRGTPAPKIANKLRRTEGATRQKAFSMGLSLDSREGTTTLRKTG